MFIKQLQKDLIGKDSHRGITLSYAWLANQLGHFSLGFIPSIILSYSFKNTNSAYFCLGIAFIWFVFECFNLFIPLLSNKKKTFSHYWAHLIFDTLTDIIFFGFGASVAYWNTPNNYYGKQIVITLIITLIYPVYYWYTTRIYQQHAGLPFQYRLSQWNGVLCKKEKKLVEGYIQNRISHEGQYLLIFGTINEGKSNLGVAIANELAIKKEKCFYTTSAKFFSELSNPNKQDNRIWNIYNCDYLIIDDINTDQPLYGKENTPKDFLSYFKVTPYDICSKNIIWVLGKLEPYEKNEWKEMIHKLCIKEDYITTINLSF